MPYIGRSLGDGVRARYIYAATSGQTSFSGNDANGIALAYSDTLYMDVYQNGVLLKPVTDYAATTGTSVVFVTGASADDVVEMIVYDSFAVADTVSAANGGTFSGNMAMGGTLNVTGAITTSAGITTTTASSIEGGVVFNEASADVDFRVESNIDTHAIFVDAGNGRIGINCDSPLNTDLQIGTNSGSLALGEAASGSGTCRLKLQGSDTQKNWQIGTNNQISGAFEISQSSSGGNTTYTGTPAFYLNSSGNLVLAGSISKGSGSFKIPHPLEAKKNSHNLVHSFVEGPQADNLYRGKVALVDGTATQNIDTVAGMSEGTFAALNREIQCFTTNETGWTAVKGSVSGNVLTITAQENTCTDTISWMVIGERKDQHMYDTDWTDDDGKVIVEPEVGSGADAPGPGAGS